MSERRGSQVHIDTEDASGGSKENVVRYVLGISLLAAIVLLSAIWITGALSEGDIEEEITRTEAAADATEEGGQSVLPQDETLNYDAPDDELGTSG